MLRYARPVRPVRPRVRPAAVALAAAVAGSGCMMVTPQLPPTDYAALERLESREDREKAFEDNTIYVHREPQGIRYTKGRSEAAPKRSWQSLDAVLRSDRFASEALPVRDLFLSRFFLGLTLVGGAATVAATAASAREGLDFSNVSGPGAVLLASSLATVALAVTSGIFFGRARKGYMRAVDVYNDSLGMRLGILTADGRYIPPPDVLVDEEGNVILDAVPDPLQAGGPAAGATASVAPRPVALRPRTGR